jgi:hypothetical protein
MQQVYVQKVFVSPTEQGGDKDQIYNQEPEPCGWRNSEASIDSLQLGIQFRYLLPG